MHRLLAYGTNICQRERLRKAALSVIVSFIEPAPADASSYVWRLTDGSKSLHRPRPARRALEVSGERTKKAAVTKALQEFIARRRQKRLLELIGKLEWDEAYDYKAERRRA
ncbi:type II toxin-antitoxin system VapB family antitoxin [Bradyrhizobium sp.]|jgi:hypothetical protein|uniref:type II toxin-antitoxin system VapB family antitoxin n=1 Tax=Bradyrhizobium sp. TaxID=376 RepID=UPI002E0CA801|nr:type II toxin-antitoxin system VapB family antitoxin [Bradyrhizobium sp.]